LTPPPATHQHSAVEPHTEEASSTHRAVAGEYGFPAAEALLVSSPRYPLEDVPWKECRSPFDSPVQGSQLPAAVVPPIGAGTLPAGQVWICCGVFPVVACEALPAPEREDDSFVQVDDDTKIPRELAASIEGYFEERVLAEERWCRLARSKSSMSSCRTDASTATPTSGASRSSSITCSSPAPGEATPHADVESNSTAVEVCKSRPQMPKLLLPGVMRREAALST